MTTSMPGWGGEWSWSSWASPARQGGAGSRHKTEFMTIGKGDVVRLIRDQPHRRARQVVWFADALVGDQLEHHSTLGGSIVDAPRPGNHLVHRAHLRAMTAGTRPVSRVTDLGRTDPRKRRIHRARSHSIKGVIVSCRGSRFSCVALFAWQSAATSPPPSLRGSLAVSRWFKDNP